ncbi:hypothetical protein LINGRAHAP2_LOCUS1804, partial [Linum grandiflorum]
MKGSSFMRIKRPKLKLPRPFTGLIRSVRDRLAGCPIHELEAMLKWSEWAKYVIDSEITAFKIWIEKKKGEAKRHREETAAAEKSNVGVANETPVHEQSPATPVGREFSNTEMGISPPNFSLRVT